MDYKKYIISIGGQEVGLSWDDIRQHLLSPARYEEFVEFMYGQTCGIIGGISIVYTGDFERFIKGLPVID